MFGLFRPKCPVDAREQAWIELRMAWLGEQLGWDTLRDAKTVLPTGDFFPLPYDGSESAAQTIYSRVCEYARQDAKELPVTFFDDQADPSERLVFGPDFLTTTHGLLACDPGSSSHSARLYIGQSVMGNLEALIAFFARGIAGYRLVRDRRISQMSEDFHQIVELMPIWFGLGIFTANTVLVESSGQSATGVGGSLNARSTLQARHFGYALALASWMTGETQPSWSRHLRRDAEATCVDGLKYLTKTGDAWFSPDSPTPSRSLSALEADLKSGTDGRRMLALWAVQDWPNENEDEKRRLSDLVAENLRHHNPIVRTDALATLDRLGPAAEPHFQEIVLALTDPKPTVRQAAAFAIGGTAREPEMVLPELVQVLKDANLSVVNAATWAVGRYGQTAKETAPHLVRVLKLGLVRVQEVLINQAVDSLMAVTDDPEAVINEVFEDGDLELARHALEAVAARRVQMSPSSDQT
ncbi:HEAT repeat domain-containing protein [Thalassoroseus pseudoceratinae]|uniref:HEAT repeat domain-containing protein n=1 Tax=Thalassoroseus pseudoceratinae TaxID=2713176 RepID=UPI001423EC08|nr:HEAT repeat domain-containing protein [Thalassoroseus pseudoceratinae]